MASRQESRADDCRLERFSHRSLLKGGGGAGVGGAIAAMGLAGKQVSAQDDAGYPLKMMPAK